MYCHGEMHPTPGGSWRQRPPAAPSVFGAAANGILPVWALAGRSRICARQRLTRLRWDKRSVDEHEPIFGVGRRCPRGYEGTAVSPAPVLRWGVTLPHEVAQWRVVVPATPSYVAAISVTIFTT